MSEEQNLPLSILHPPGLAIATLMRIFWTGLIVQDAFSPLATDGT